MKDFLAKKVCIFAALAAACLHANHQENNCPTPPDQWPQLNHDRYNTSHNPVDCINAKNVEDLVQLWNDAGPTVYDAITVGNDPDYGQLLYYEDYSGVLRCKNALTGDTLWKILLDTTTTTDPHEKHSAPLISNDHLYIGSNGAVAYKIDRFTGEIIWSRELAPSPLNYIFSGPVIADEFVIFTTDSNEGVKSQPPYTFRGAVYALDVFTGDIVWSFVPSEGYGPGVGFRRSTPAIDTERGYLYIGTSNATAAPSGPLSNAIICLNYRTTNPNGELIWSYQFAPNDIFSLVDQNTDNPSTQASPNLLSIDGRDLVGIGSRKGVYTVFDRQTGEVIWEQDIIPEGETPGIIGYASGTLLDRNDNGKDLIIITGGVYDPLEFLPASVFLGAINGNFQNQLTLIQGVNKELKTSIRALRAQDGKVIWEKTFDGAVAGSLSSTDHVVFIAGFGGQFFALDARTGKILFELENPTINVFGSPVILPFGAPPIVSKGRIFIGSGFQVIGGGIFAYTLPELLPQGPAVVLAED